MRKINLGPSVALFLFTMIYISASIVFLGNLYRPLTPELIFTRYALLFVGFSVLIFIYFIKNRLPVFRFSSFFSIFIFMIWMFFSVSVCLSQIIHLALPVDGLFFLVGVPFIYFSVMPFFTKRFGPVIHQTLFAANLFYVLISFLTVKVEYLPYMGITANPNSLGQMSAIAAITGYFVLISHSKKRILIRLAVFACIILSIVGVMLSASRTSFLVVVIVTMIISFHYIVTKWNFMPMLTLILLGLIGWVSPLKESLFAGLTDKFLTFYQQGDFWNGRTGNWLIVIKDATLFGNGEDYFNKFFEGAHNSIIFILGVYGIIPAIFLTAFLLFLNVSAFIKSYKNKQDPLAIFPFAIILTFSMFSMTEDMFGLIGNAITIAFYHVAGLLLIKDGKMRARSVFVMNKIRGLRHKNASE